MDLYILIHAVIAQIFDRTAEFIVPLGTPANKAKSEIEKHPMIGETKISICSK